MQVVVPLIMNGNEIRSVLLEALASDPTATAARIYYNTGTHRVRYYDGTVWQELAAEVFTQTVHNSLDHSAVASTFRLDEVAAPNADLSIASHKLTNVTDPTAAQDAATKAYVDAQTAGARDPKDSVRAASTANGTLATAFANGQTMDGVTLVTGDRILLKNQTTGSENGIRVVTAGTPTRATDADTSAEVTGGMYVWVNEGTTNADTGWLLTTNDPIVLDTTSLVFTQVSALGQITAGAGLTKTAATLDAVAGTTFGTAGPGGGLKANADDLVVDSDVVARRKVFNVGDGASTTITLTHNFGTRDIVVEVYRNSSPWDTIVVDVQRSSTNAVDIVFPVAPSSNQYRASVLS